MRNEFGASWNAGELFGNDGNAIENTLLGGHVRLLMGRELNEAG